MLHLWLAQISNLHLIWSNQHLIWINLQHSPYPDHETTFLSYFFNHLDVSLA